MSLFKPRLTDLQSRPGTQIRTHRRAWLLALFAAVTSLAAGLLVLWLLLPLAWPEAVDGRADSEPLRMEKEDFRPVMAAAWLSGAGEEIIPPGIDRRQTLLVAGADFEAERFGQMALDLRSLPADASVYLLWRGAGTPQTVAAAELRGAGQGKSWHSLAGRAGWSGTISGIALVSVSGRQQGTMSLSGVSFHAASRRALIERSLSQWTRFDPWTMSSINRWAGARGDVILHPAAAFAAWSAISLVIFLLAVWRMRFARPVLAGAALMVLFVPWLGLDRLWQGQLEQQLEATQARYGGLSQAQKHQREMDAEIQRYAAHLARILPRDAGHRIFLLHDSRGHNFWRLRLQFHLLPRNIYNFGSELLPEMRSGDYVVVLGEIDDIRFDAARGLLSDGDLAWRAQLVDRHSDGRVYHLDGDGSGEAGG